MRTTSCELLSSSIVLLSSTRSLRVVVILLCSLCTRAPGLDSSSTPSSSTPQRPLAPRSLVLSSAPTPMPAPPQAHALLFLFTAKSSSISASGHHPRQHRLQTPAPSFKTAAAFSFKLQALCLFSLHHRRHADSAERPRYRPLPIKCVKPVKHRHPSQTKTLTSIAALVAARTHRSQLILCRPLTHEFRSQRQRTRPFHSQLCMRYIQDKNALDARRPTMHAVHSRRACT